jgi:uncharacterized integral membrane protein
MSSPSQQLPPSKPAAESRSRREKTRAAAMALLAVVMTLFAVLNVKDVKVNWIVGSSRAPLIIVIAISLLVGIVLTHFAERRTRKRK